MRTPPSPVDALVVRPQPAPHRAADVPGGVVPDQDQRRGPRGRQARAAPGQELRGQGADRSPVHEAQPQLLGVGAAAASWRTSSP